MWYWRSISAEKETDREHQAQVGAWEFERKDRVHYPESTGLPRLTPISRKVRFARYALFGLATYAIANSAVASFQALGRLDSQKRAQRELAGLRSQEAPKPEVKLTEKAPSPREALRTED
jgi:hypothetical protein